ncbi:hypothetical protein ACX0G9_16600 [Flavitalea flava]
MKKLLLSALLLPFASLAGFIANPSESKNLLEVRAGDWPINLDRYIDRRDTTYLLMFRDQQVMSGVVMDTLPFPGLQQLKYFEQALTVLKTGHNGDIARFKTYSLKRADKKNEGTWYILRDKYGLTDFQQTEADMMTKTIKGL